MHPVSRRVWFALAGFATGVFLGARVTVLSPLIVGGGGAAIILLRRRRGLALAGVLLVSLAAGIAAGDSIGSDPAPAVFRSAASSPDGVAGAVSGRVRAALRDATNGLDRSRAALVRGLAIGDDGDLEEPAVEALRRAGLAHLVAVSGSNVAIVIGVAVILARRTGLRARLLLAAAVLVLYVMVVGPEPSVLRAALMGSVTLAALAFGRSSEPLHALGLALIVLLVFQPAFLWSVGLHLSAAATAGIVLWADPIARRLHRLPRTIALVLGATVAAQVAVSPILAGVFGEMPLLAAPANLLAFPAVAPATILGLLAGSIGVVSPALASPFGFLAGTIAGWILTVAEVFGTPDWSAAEVPSWMGVVLGLPVALAALVRLRTSTPR